MDDSRRRYIRHLREEYRKSPRAAADADLQRHKARLLEMKVARQERETILVSEHEEFLDSVMGLTLTHLSGWPNEVASIQGVNIPVKLQLERFYDSWGSDQTYPHLAVPWTWAFDTPFSWTKQVASHFGARLPRSAKSDVEPIKGFMRGGVNLDGRLASLLLLLAKDAGPSKSALSAD
jgi:hypothetical protein